jgi:tRNA/rRNA methyltransferase/tRNA (cytidine32/uridine32-2'-O)-methyltransferase
MLPLKEDVIVTRAVHAADVWAQAQHYDDVAAAVADCSVAVGVTRRGGKDRTPLTMDPPECAAFLHRRQGGAAGEGGTAGTAGAALVFGNEQSGLSAEELAVCNFGSHIPSCEAFPSLNLSHAVQIYTYELFREWSRGPSGGLKCDDATSGKCLDCREADCDGGFARHKGAWEPLGQAEIAAGVRRITNSLEPLGFYKKPGRERQEQFLRNLLSRAGVTKDEARYLEGIFAKAARL